MNKLQKRNQAILVVMTIVIIVMIAVSFLYISFGNIVLVGITWVLGFIFFTLSATTCIESLTELFTEKVSFKKGVILSLLAIITSTISFSLLYIAFLVIKPILKI